MQGHPTRAIGIADILLLISRDAKEAHQLVEQVVGPTISPFAQRLKIGWVVVGEMCLGSSHKKIYLTPEGRPTVFPPCANKFEICELTDCLLYTKPQKSDSKDLPSDVFMQTELDNAVGHAIEETKFLNLMNKELNKDEDGQWCAPLPFCVPRKKLPNNR